jgi:phage baseplate assembly protein W
MAVVKVPNIRSINWSPELGSFGQVVENVRDIEQCISTILLTPRGSDPHRPEFATGIFDYIDYPQNEVTQLLIKEVYESIIRWEPRINILNVSINLLTDEIERIEVVIEWAIKNTNFQNVTTVRL